WQPPEVGPGLIANLVRARNDDTETPSRPVKWVEPIPSRSWPQSALRSQECATRDRSNRFLGAQRETHIQDRRGKAKHRSDRVKLCPMLKQGTRLCCAEIPTRCK